MFLFIVSIKPCLSKKRTVITNDTLKTMIIFFENDNFNNHSVVVTYPQERLKSQHLVGHCKGKRCICYPAEKIRRHISEPAVWPWLLPTSFTHYPVISSNNKE